MRIVFVSMMVLLLLVIPMGVQAAVPESQAKIIINIPGKTLDYYKSGQWVKRYKIGVGTKDNQTPIGSFKIVYKELNPTWIKPVAQGDKPVIIESGPNNPLGYRWMEFLELYGIHGTNLPETVGRYVSNGCIRMKESDVEELYNNTPLQTPVEITYERLVMEQTPAGVILHIYADEYNAKPLTVESIDTYLAKNGVQGLFDRDALAWALANNVSESFPIGEVFSAMIFGKKLAAKVIKIDGDLYFPLLPIAQEVQAAISWDPQTAKVTSANGTADGYVKNNIVYIKAGGLLALFQLYFGFYPDPHTVYMDYAPLQQ